jgi:hypothetical protein
MGYIGLVIVVMTAVLLYSCQAPAPTIATSPVSTPAVTCPTKGNAMSLPTSGTIANAILSVISGLIGIAVGYWLGERAQRRREKKQEQSTRDIISLEIDRNLDLLRELWPKVSQANDLEQDAKSRKHRLARSFVEIPFPDWSREAFDNQPSSLAIALSKQELIRVGWFYDRLHRLETIRAELKAAMQEQDRRFIEETVPGPGGYRRALAGYRPPQMFNRNAENFWDECESLVAQLLARGNPLK